MSRTIIGLGSLLGAWMITTPASAEPVLSGPEVVNLSAQSINVMHMQLYEIKARMDMDDAPTHMAARYRGTPADFVLNDGRIVRNGRLWRIGVSFGSGGGKPRSGVAYFWGLNLDSAKVDGNGAQVNTVEFSNQIYDGLGYAGVAVKGFALSAGIRNSEEFSGLDVNKQFVGSGGTFVRTGAPEESRRLFGDRRSGDNGEKHFHRSYVLSLYQAEGVSLGGVVEQFEELSATGAANQLTRLSALRAMLLPESLFQKLDLRKYGVPSLGLDRYAAGVDYYADRYREYRDAARTGASLPSGSNATYLVPAGVYDIAKLGVRAVLTTQVSPTPMFRSLEAGWLKRASWEGFDFDLGARGFAFRRADSLTAGGDAFLAAGIGRFHLAFSASYNSPESSTFFPIPNAFVYGFQFALGPVEMAQPLIPMIAQTRAAKKEGASDAKAN